MNSSQITNRILQKFPHIGTFVTRIRTSHGWGVFVPSADKNEQEEILDAFGRPEQNHDLVGIVIPLSPEESVSLDEAQTAFNKAGGHGSIR